MISPVCTTIRVRTTSGEPMIARTMEFAQDLGWRLLVVPRGTGFTGTAPGGAGHRWTARHGFVGVGALEQHVAVEEDDTGREQEAQEVEIVVPPLGLFQLLKRRCLRHRRRCQPIRRNRNRVSSHQL